MCPARAVCWATLPKSPANPLNAATSLTITPHACRPMNPDRTIPGDWYPGRVPENVLLDPTAYLETSYSFLLFTSRRPGAIEIGPGSSLYLGVMFDLGANARFKVGSYVLMNGARIICDSEITIGDYSLISWNVVLMDTYRLSLEPLRR